MPPSPAEPSPRAAATAVGLSDGFSVVGSVAVLAGDGATVTASDTGFGVSRDNMAEIARRFIRAFGDDYDQIAVFLGFNDRLSLQALAYQLPVKNDVGGLGLGRFDTARDFGSASGRMQTMLNMKSINVYGLDAASNPENTLYPVWAQEAAHRWLTYFRFRRTTDRQNRDDLLGRQTAHWAPWVHAEGSVLDGVYWRENGDGTFTPLERDKRFGSLDQYGMGLRAPSEVPPFFLLENVIDEQGQAVSREDLASSGALRPNRRYRATKVPLTVQDIIRAVGARTPASGGAAVDLRMGVVFLTPPGLTAADRIGEAFLVDQTRAPWDDFYNQAGGGRGKVCTELLRPCRGPSFTFTNPRLRPEAGGDEVTEPGDRFVYEIDVTNRGDEDGVARVELGARVGLAFDAASATTPQLRPGGTSTLRVSGSVPADAPCVAPLRIEHEAAGRLGPSRGSTWLRLGLSPRRHFDFESEADRAGWRVNPDGTDTATAGAFELGTPERTVASVLPGFVIQPAGARSGQRAWVTGAAAGANEADNDLDFDRTRPEVGRTTLESPPIPLSGVRNPRLRYYTYFVAVDFDRRVLVPARNDNLHVLVSFSDAPDGGGGTPWVEVDRVTGIGLDWQERLVDLTAQFGFTPDGRLPATVRLRFVAEDDPASDNVVEAVIDDVTLLAEGERCTTTTVPMLPLPAPPDAGPGAAAPMSEAGCGCRIGGRGTTARGLAFALVLTGLTLAPWRRRGR